MTKLIRELAREAGIKLAHDESLALGFLDTKHKKFAESIVNKLVDLLEEDRTSYADVGTYESSEYYVRMKAKEEAIADAIDRVKYLFGAN